MARKYYALCDSNCKFETMSKEQILTAIMQAVNEGTIGDIDTGFITTIKTINGFPLRFFVGSQSEYENLSDEDKQNLFAIITNDTTKESLLETLTALQKDVDALLKRTGGKVVSGTKLTEAGFYHIRCSATADGSSYDFGLIYWDGLNSADKTCLDWRLHIEKDGVATITTRVDIPLYGDSFIPSGTDMTDSFVVHVTRFGE